MPINIRNADHSSLPTEHPASTISQSSVPQSTSPQELQARINQEIKNAAQNFEPMVAASTFTTQTDDTTTTINFGDGMNGAKLPANAAGEAGYRTGSGQAGNDATPGSTQESQLAGILKSELGVDGQDAQALANAIAHGGQSGMGLAFGIAKTIANVQSSSSDTNSQAGPQDPAADPPATGGKDLSALIDREKIRHIKA